MTEENRTGPAGRRQATRHSSSNATFRIPPSCFAGLHDHEPRAKGTMRDRLGSRHTTSENRTPQNNARTITGKPEGVIALLCSVLSCAHSSFVSERLFVQTMDVVFIRVSETQCSMRSEGGLSHGVTNFISVQNLKESILLTSNWPLRTGFVRASDGLRPMPELLQ